ncbi:MAG: PAS domain S-box protein, partial [Desulfobacterales bacterium]|nr:PAS domain S-box protein [Desulfobacterales bacterium]
MQKEDALSILLVEDDRVDQRECQRLLQRSSLVVEKIRYAESLADALTILANESFDFVLVDLNLPDCMGMDTFIALQEEYAHIPMVVVTGEDGQEMGLQAVAHGAQDYLIKGQIDTDILHRSIRYAVERKRAEEALRRERDFAERVIETTQAIVLVLDTEMRIVRFNSYMRFLTGYEVEELQAGDWLAILIRDDHHASFREIFNATLKQACGLGLVNTLRTKEGRERCIEWATSALQDSTGQIVGVLATGQDISERTQAQEAIKAQAAFLETLVAAIPCPMFYKDRNGTYLGCNRAFERISGLKQEQIVGCTEEDIWPRSCVALNAEMDRELLSSPGNIQYESRWEASDGSLREVIVCKSTFNNVQGDVDGIIGALLDITKRSQAEAAMREANMNLERANRDLQEMHGQVIQSEKLASIGQLAAGVAHEMNTPIGFVASNFETLQKYIRKITTQLHTYEELLETIPVTEEVKEARTQGDAKKMAFILEDIHQLFEESKEGLDRVTSIVQNLRDFSRINNEEELETFNINEGLRATLIVARNAIKYDADVELELGDVPAVLCSSGQLNQVFLNIVVNAAQAIKMQERTDR